MRIELSVKIIEIEGEVLITSPTDAPVGIVVSGVTIEEAWKEYKEAHKDSLEFLQQTTN